MFRACFWNIASSGISGLVRKPVKPLLVEQSLWYSWALRQLFEIGRFVKRVEDVVHICESVLIVLQELCGRW